MPSRISNPSAGEQIIGIFAIGEGGHGKQVAREGLLALGGFAKSDIGTPFNCIPLDANGEIAKSYFGGITIVETGLDGPLAVARGSLNVFYLTTYDNFIDYVVGAERGTVELKGKTLFYRAPIDPGEDTITIDTRTYTVDVLGVMFEQPTIISPSSGYQGSFSDILVSSSTPIIINNPGTESHQSTDWELSTEADFSLIYRCSYHSSDMTEWMVTGLQQLKTYYLRVRYNGQHGASEWSEPVQFMTTVPEFIVPPFCLYPADREFGVPVPLTILASAFIASGYADTHHATDWLIATTSNFGTVVEQSMYDEVNLTQYMPQNLEPMTLYYVKFRYHGEGKTSLWSNAISFILDYPQT